MAYYLGIDTSNYTTSAAIFDSVSGRMKSCRKLLPVKPGECGLRQSDAVFHHVQQLPCMMEQLFDGFDGEISAIGVSSTPRNAEGSYMPCFTVGHGAARTLAGALKVPLYTFSHQSGHIAAALYSAKKTQLVGERFLAFHVSGGTTEAVLVGDGGEKIFDTRLVARTLDLNAGQLIDRTGVMLGLQFPCGKELEKLATENTEKLSVRVTLKGADCCLSGIQNVCQRAWNEGRSKQYVSALCLEYVEKTIAGMCDKLLSEYGSLPIVFAGGVMSDRIIREGLEKKYDSWFAEPEYSTDNACGTAFLCSLRHRK